MSLNPLLLTTATCIESEAPVHFFTRGVGILVKRWGTPHHFFGPILFITYQCTLYYLLRTTTFYSHPSYYVPVHLPPFFTPPKGSSLCIKDALGLLNFFFTSLHSYRFFFTSKMYNLGCITSEMLHVQRCIAFPFHNARCDRPLFFASKMHPRSASDRIFDSKDALVRSKEDGTTFGAP